MKTIIDRNLCTLSKEFGANSCLVYICLNAPKDYNINRSMTGEAIGLIVSSNHNAVNTFKTQQTNKGDLQEDRIKLGSRRSVDHDNSFTAIYNESLAIDIVLLFAPKLKAKFVFYSKEPFTRDLSANIELINAKLLQAVMSINNSHKLIRQSLMSMGLFNCKTVDIITLVSDGYSREEVAAKLNLSVSGVDYYIEIAKLSFEANTLSELVYRASKYGLLRVSLEEGDKHEN